MLAPDFWRRRGPVSVLLAPLSWLWVVGAVARQVLGRPRWAPIPVICVGNLVTGGAGKTPIAMSLARRIPGAHLLTAGYGGSEEGPLQVDPKRHDASQVGDEALLLAERAPCWVARDRHAGALAAAKAGASDVDHFSAVP